MQRDWGRSRINAVEIRRRARIVSEKVTALAGHIGLRGVGAIALEFFAANASLVSAQPLKIPSIGRLAGQNLRLPLGTRPP
jgi:hypothetical protein